MKKHIGLIELAFHNEVLRAYIVALLETDFEITVFSNDFNYNQIYDFQNHQNLSWELKKNDESNEKYLKRVNAAMSNCDLLLISTLPKDSIFDKLDWPAKTVFVVHDVHYYFEPRKHISASSGFVDNTKDNIRIVKYFLSNERKRNLVRINNFDHLALPSKQVYDYVKGKEYSDDFPFDSVFDFAVHEPKWTPEGNENEIIITIPGIVGNKSRDYDFLQESLIKLKTLLKQKVIVQILGKPKAGAGRRHIRKLKAIESENLQIITYQDFIDQKEFDAVMAKTHFLVLPILQQIRFEVGLEKTGYSCVSGNINDMVKYGIPAILPEYIPLEKPCEKMVLRYDISYDLPHKIQEWVENKEYVKKRENASKFLAPLNPEEMGKEFKKQILKLL